MAAAFFSQTTFKQVLAAENEALRVQLVVHNEIASTSSDLMTRLSADGTTPTVVIAKRQTGGRGRSGNTWHSAHDQNLYISVSVPIVGHIAERLPLVPLAAGVAAATTLGSEGIKDISLKWPNDMLVHKKKVGGILCETPGIDGDRAIAVVGMGVNIGAQEFPADLLSIADYISPPPTQPQFREVFAAKWVAALFEQCNRVQLDQKADLIQQWKQHAEPFGRRVKVGDMVGHTVDLNKDGRLVIKKDSGELETIPGGMVESLD